MLRQGDVLSYSASSLSNDPYKFRKVEKQPLDLSELRQKFPGLGDFLGEKIPIFLNACPAPPPALPQGVTVDSYLSRKAISRAMHLAKAEDTTPVILAQPLFLAHILLFKRKIPHTPPQKIIGIACGHVLPFSLETALNETCRQMGVDLFILHAYGVTEVDPVCLFAHREKNQQIPVYHPKNRNVKVSIENQRLLLSLGDGAGKSMAGPVDTGDFAQEFKNGYIIWNNASKLSLQILEFLETWTPRDWRRRTGHLAADHQGKLTIQLRENQAQKTRNEMDFYRFGQKYAVCWLDKPQWNGRLSKNSHDPDPSLAVI